MAGEVYSRSNCEEPPFTEFVFLHGKNFTCANCPNCTEYNPVVPEKNLFPEGCICPQECDCQNPKTPENEHEGVHHVSMFCPVCNDNPNPHDECPVHKHMSNFEFNTR